MTRYDPLKIEPEILQFWQKRRIFDKLRKKLSKSKKRFSFLDGPITANNPMGVHHAWGRTYKDVFQRFWAMRGYNQRWQNGFDCQGLWIEREVEKDKGLKSKKDIEEFGFLNFINACKERVKRFSRLQTKDSIRLGQWMDWGNDYYTMSDTNNEHNWMLLKAYHKKGWLYKGKDAVPWCPRCGTASSKHDIVTEGYKEVTHTGLYIRLPLKGKKKEYILIFTTTPWTIPANVAAAVNGNITYVKVRQNGNRYWLAKSRVPYAMTGDYKIEKEVVGKELVNLEYEPPYPDMPEQKRALHRVVEWELASGEEGTGIVHIAPGCGPEDYDLGQRKNLPAPSPLNPEGLFMHGWGFLTGLSAHEANKSVLKDLEKRGLVYKTEPYSHRYPHCWRCGTELVFRLEDEWYVKAGEIRPLLKRENEKIRWFPEYGKVRQNDWFDAMGDWLISRKRYWGLPLPFWECVRCSRLEVIGSLKELKQKAVRGIRQLKELHRPWIDNVILRCPKCKSDMKRVPDVGDAWLDAGIVPFSTIGPYMKNRKKWEKWYPADFICENLPGQYRGWFNALFWAGVTLTGKAPFKSILGYETVKDEAGREMHKSLGNVIWAKEALDKMGADPVRWRYCLQDSAAELWFGYKATDEVRRSLNVVWNLGEYLKVNFNKKFKPREVKPVLAQDRWILSRLESTKKDVTEQMEALHPRRASMALQNFFLNELSRGYVHFVREELNENTVQILYKALLSTLKLMAPFVPFVTEKVYQEVFRQKEKAESIHLLDWPAVNEKLIDKNLEREFAYLQDIISNILALREKIKRSLRWPVKSAVVLTEKKELSDAVRKHSELVKKVANLLEIKVTHEVSGVKHEIKTDYSKIGPKFGKNSAIIVAAIDRMSPESVLRSLKKDGKIKLEVKGEEVELQREDLIIEEVLPKGLVGKSLDNYSIYLETEETEAMLQKGFAREFTRAVQELRKKAGLQKADKIELYVCAPASSKAGLEADIGAIKERVGAKEINFVASKVVQSRKTKGRLKVRGFEAQIGL